MQARGDLDRARPHPGVILTGYGFALGMICLRLGGAFLAIATLGFALASAPS